MGKYIYEIQPKRGKPYCGPTRTVSHAFSLLRECMAKAEEASRADSVNAVIVLNMDFDPMAEVCRYVDGIVVMSHGGTKPKRKPAAAKRKKK